MSKKARNPFFCFLLDYKRREESRGRTFRGIDEVRDIVGPIWANMDSAKRQPFIERAKQDKLKIGGASEKKASNGITLSQIDAEKKAKELKAQRLTDRIASMLTRAGMEENALQTLDFHLICIDYFCELNDGRLVPAELGAVRYSLGEGVSDTFHMLINPGNLPPGMAYDAKRRSDNYHQLPIPPNALGEPDFMQIKYRLLEWLRAADGNIPLLFTNRDEVPRVQNMLEQILDGHDIPVCPLSTLFFHLKKTTMAVGLDDHKHPPESIMQQFIDRDSYEFTAGIGCQHHEQIESTTFCALARCVRWAYVISDHCCMDMCIDLQPGRHVPLDTKTTFTLLDEGTSSARRDSYENDNMSFISSSSVSRFSHPTVAGRTTRDSSPTRSDYDGRSTASGDRKSFGANSRQRVNSLSDFTDNQTHDRAEKSEADEVKFSNTGLFAAPMGHPVANVGRGRAASLENRFYASKLLTGIRGVGRGRIE